MLKLVILACAISGPCESHWWFEPFRTKAGCYVAGHVAAHDWLRAHPGFVLRHAACEPDRSAAPADLAAGSQSRLTR